MTVTTIGNAGEAIRRLQEQQNKQADTRSVSKTPGTATLPVDEVAPSVAAALKSVSNATADVEAQNREAAKSVLSDEDIERIEQGGSAQEKIQAAAKASIQAQTNRLPPSMLTLLVE